MRNCGESWTLGRGQRGAQQQGKRKRFPLNSSYRCVFSNAIQLWSFTEEGAVTGWNRNQMLNQHSSTTASSSTTAKTKMWTTAEQGTYPFGNAAQNKPCKAARSAAASRVLCNREFEKDAGCLINREMLCWMRGELQCSSVLFSASSLSPPQACHSRGNGNRANNKDQIVPVTRHSSRSCISKRLYLRAHS